MEDEEKDIEIPQDGDENIGEGAPKKKIKKRKSKEERLADRKKVFWTLLIVLLITLGFWLVPRVSKLISGESIVEETNIQQREKPETKKNEHKNYVEITL